jgi:hypothetical protein
MRMAFGLVSLLITLGVIVMILHYAILPYNKVVIQKGQTARQEAEQMAGSMDGMRTTESIKLEPQSSGDGKPVSLLVTSIVKGGPMEVYFGLQRNDTITEINGLKVKDQNDGELSAAMALEAYQRRQTLTVVRDGQTIVLPQAQRAVPLVAPGQPAAAQQQPKQGTDNLQQQLDAIQTGGGAR